MDDRRRAWSEEAALRSDRSGGATSAEDQVLCALLTPTPESLAAAARLLADTALLDHDYLAYWVDELRLRESWRALG